MKKVATVFILSLCFGLGIRPVQADDPYVDAITIAKNFVARLYSSTPDELPAIHDAMNRFSADVFPHIFVELYQSEHWTEEGAPILVGFVWPVYTNRVTLTRAQEQLHQIIVDPDNPIALRRDVLRDISAWTPDSDTESTLMKLSGIGTPGDDIWLYAQYGASKLLHSAYSKAKRQPGTPQEIDKLEKLSQKRAKEIIRDLLKHYSNNKMLDKWTAKILANYRKVTPYDLEEALVQGLSEGNFDASKQLDILDLTCGWGEKSQTVADHVKKIKDKADREGQPLADQDAKKAEKLLSRQREE